MSEEPTKFELPPFIPIFLGLDEHLRKGQMSLADLGVYLLLNRWCDWRWGIYYGCAATIASLMGGRTNIKEVQRSLHNLRRFGFVNYRQGTGSRGSYNILIHKYLPRVGGLRGYRLNVFCDNNLSQPLYERLGGEGTVAGWSEDGGQTGYWLYADGDESETRPLQECKEFKSVRVLEFKNPKIKASGVVSGDPQPPAAIPSGRGLSRKGTEHSVDGVPQTKPLTQIEPPAAFLLNDGDPSAQLALRFFEYQGNPDKYAADLPQWQVRFARLIDTYGADQLREVMEFGFGDEHWSKVLVRFSTHPLDYFEEHIETLAAKFLAMQTAAANANKKAKKEKSDVERNNKNNSRTAGNGDAVEEALSWLREIQQPDASGGTD